MAAFGRADKNDAESSGLLFLFEFHMHEHTVVVVAVIHRDKEITNRKPLQDILMNRHVIRIHKNFLELVVKIIDRLRLVPAADGEAGENLCSKDTLETRRVHFLRCRHTAKR